MWNSSPLPKYAALSFGIMLASERRTVPGNSVSIIFRTRFRKACVSGRFSQFVPGGGERRREEEKGRKRGEGRRERRERRRKERREMIKERR